MSDLTIEELKEKIEQIKQDMAKSDDLKSRLVLTDYISYLQDEIRMLENVNRAGTGTGK